MTPAQAKLVAQKLGDEYYAQDNAVFPTDPRSPALDSDQIIGRLMDVWVEEGHDVHLARSGKMWNAGAGPASWVALRVESSSRIDAVLALLEKLG